MTMAAVVESAAQPDGADDGPADAGCGDVLQRIFRGAADGGRDLVIGNPAVEKLARAKTSPVARSIAFPDGGLYVLADSQPSRRRLVVDAGPQGTGRSGHGHADALSLRLTMDGRRWLVDSGAASTFERSRGSERASRDWCA